MKFIYKIRKLFLFFGFVLQCTQIKKISQLKMGAKLPKSLVYIYIFKQRSELLSSETALEFWWIKLISFNIP